MGKEITPRVQVSQPEVGSQCSQTLARLLVALVTVLNHDHPVIVDIARKPGHAVSRYLVLEVDIGDRWTDIVRVEGLVGDDVPQLDTRSIFDVFDGLRFVVVLGIAVGGGVENPPQVILIPVWVEGNLLFYTKCQLDCDQRRSVTYVHSHRDNCEHVNAGNLLGYSDDG